MAVAGHHAAARHAPGIVVFGLGAVHSSRSVAGTTLAGASVFTGDAAGLLMVALASLVHQISGGDDGDDDGDRRGGEQVGPGAALGFDHRLAVTR